MLGFLKSGKSIAEPIDAIGNAFDKIFTSDEERLKAKAVYNKIAQHPHILQAEINKVEAQHRSIFVAGWRPFIGWGCGFSILWHFSLYDFFSWLASLCNLEMPPEPTNTENLLTLVTLLLGFGGIRTFEKLKGLTK